MITFSPFLLDRWLRCAGQRAALLLALVSLASAAFGQTFSPPTIYATGVEPHSVALGDVNGDGRPDIVTANKYPFTNDGVSVLLGTGTGSFGPKTDYTTGAEPWSIALGDVNGDGRLDIITGSANIARVSVLLGTGMGSFGPKTDYDPGGRPHSVALGDVNGDGRLDIVTANYDNLGTASVLLGTGAGSFGSATLYPAGGFAHESIALGDVNGDGRLDIVTENSGQGQIVVLLGTGTGSFGPATSYPTGGGTYSVAIGDVNGDGRPDLVGANYVNDTVSVLLNTFTGTGSCATPDVYYQNTSLLPPETRTRGQIIAGSSVKSGTTGPVTLQYPNYAGFISVGQISLLPGFSVEGPRNDGATIFSAVVVPCAAPQTPCDCLSMDYSRASAALAATPGATPENSSSYLFPNPSAGRLEFRPGKIEVQNTGYFVVYDIAGREVKSIDCRKAAWHGESVSLDVSSLADGLYQYRFVSGAYSTNGRFAIKK